MIATFSSGMVRIRVDDEITQTEVVDGWLSLSTDDAWCRSTASEVCTYTINRLTLRSGPFRVAGIDFDAAAVFTARPSYFQREIGGRIELRPMIPFWLEGFISGRSDRILEFAAPSPTDRFEIADLLITPTESQATIHGSVTGEVGERTIRVSVMASADTPFRNLPPVPVAPPPSVAEAGCFADLVLGAEGTTDPEGDLAATWYELGESSLGAAHRPIRFPIGEFPVTLVAVDGRGGQATATTTVTVRDDGSVAASPGSGVVSVEVPAGASLESFALVALDRLDVGNRSEAATTFLLQALCLRVRWSARRRRRFVMPGGTR